MLICNRVIYQRLDHVLGEEQESLIDFKPSSSNHGYMKSNSFEIGLKDGEGLTCSNHRSNVVETTKDKADNCHEVIII